MKRLILLLLAAVFSVMMLAGASPTPAPTRGGAAPTPTPPRSGSAAPAPNPVQPAPGARSATKPVTKPTTIAATKPTPPTSLPTTGKALSDEEYKTLFSAELGKLWKPEMLDSCKSAQKLLDQYFAMPAKRKETVASLEKLNLDPNLVGRLTRIRGNWPELKPGIYYNVEKMGTTQVQYFIGIPKGYNRTKATPLVVWLCDFVPFLDKEGNLLDLRVDQVAELYARWIDTEMREHPDAAVMMPIINVSVKWGPGYEGHNRAFFPVLNVQDKVNIDPAQIYLVGHSLPAESIWDQALMHPTYFTSMMPLAGEVVSYFQTLRMPNLRNIPVFLWHDVDDDIVSVDLAKAIVKDLKAKGGKIEYKETKKIGHFPTVEICNELYKKMRAVKRDLYPKQISLASNRPELTYNRNDWIQVFQYLDPGKDEHIITNMTSILGSQNPCSFDAKIDPAKNQITATGKNIQSMRIYLNDQMVDMSKNVVITYNGAKRYDAVPKASLGMMLEDQLLLGRGWRYYTSYVEIDFAAIAESHQTPAPGPTTNPAPRR